jgi:serine/threonine protein kinase
MGNKIASDSILDGKESDLPVVADSKVSPGEKGITSPVDLDSIEECIERGRAAVADSKTMDRMSIPSPSADALGESGAVMNLKLSITDFELLTVVGRGSFGKVMQVRKKDTGKIYAMKVLKKKAIVQRRQITHTKAERRILERINHPFIVSLRFAFQNETKLYMVLDYFNGGELFFHLRNDITFPEARTRFYAAEIVLGIEHLHSLNIVYRDLKPENVLLDDEGHIKLTDFGLSKETMETGALTHTFCGTPEYLAPEVLEGEGYGKCVDWWSLGALLYEMLSGNVKLQLDSISQLLSLLSTMIMSMSCTKRFYMLLPSFLRQSQILPRISSRKFVLAIPSLLTFNQLLEKDPSRRLGAGGSVEIKKHLFFKSIDWDKIYAKEIEPPFKPALTVS